MHLYCIESSILLLYLQCCTIRRVVFKTIWHAWFLRSINLRSMKWIFSSTYIFSISVGLMKQHFSLLGNFLMLLWILYVFECIYVVLFMWNWYLCLVVCSFDVIFFIPKLKVTFSTVRLRIDIDKLYILLPNIVCQNCPFIYDLPF